MALQISGEEKLNWIGTDMKKFPSQKLPPIVKVIGCISNYFI
jgi:hypothetical protein